MTKEDEEKFSETLEPSLQEEKTPKESFLQAATSEALRPFVIISSSYLLFTITDGAIRMIVLLHAYNKSFSAMQVALMFTLYELAGVFTNLVRSVLFCTIYLCIESHLTRFSRPPAFWAPNGASSLH